MVHSTGAGISILHVASSIHLHRAEDAAASGPSEGKMEEESDGESAGQEYIGLLQEEMATMKAG